MRPRTSYIAVKGQWAVLLISLLVTSLLLASSGWASRGIKVVATTSNGSQKEVSLYSGYHALVVGCGNYLRGWPKLPNPVKDAREVAQTLEEMGWQVDLLEDPDWSTLRTALNRLIIGPGRDQEQAILIWYSGHGHTLAEIGGTKLGYIVPVDAPNPDQDELGFMEHAISMRQIESVAKRIRSRHVMMLFDSCFSGAIFQAVRSRPTPYIEEKVSKSVRQFITAGTEDEQVPDRSVFKVVFLQGIKDGYADRNGDGYVTGLELGDYLQEKVVNYTRKAQHPQFGKINDPKLDKGDFVFVIPKPMTKPTQPLTSLEAEHQRIEAEKKRIVQELERLRKEREILKERKALEEARKELEAERKRLEEEKRLLSSLSSLEAERLKVEKEKKIAVEEQERLTRKREQAEQRLPQEIAKRQPETEIKPSGEERPVVAISKSDTQTVQSPKAPAEVQQAYAKPPPTKPQTTPAGRFIDNADGTVTDTKTGLMWQKGGSEEDLTLRGAESYVRELNKNRFGGYSNWRIPEIDELKMLFLDAPVKGMMIDPVFDERIQSCWSSSRIFSGPQNFVRNRGADFKDGITISILVEDTIWKNEGTSHVRAVRGSFDAFKRK